MAKIIVIEIPDEFAQLCNYDMVAPKSVLCGFIADVCGITVKQDEPAGETYFSSSSEDRNRARSYYDRVCGWHGQWIRKNIPKRARQWQKNHAPSEVTIDD